MVVDGELSPLVGEGDGASTDVVPVSPVNDDNVVEGDLPGLCVLSDVIDPSREEEVGAGSLVVV